jgi:hypothetical protein
MKRSGLAILALCSGLLASSAVAAPTGGVFLPDRGPGLFATVQGPACRACRRDCYARYRVYCGYSEGCRRSFTLCMRDCWYGYCR